MANQSSAPPKSIDDKARNSASEVSQPICESSQDANGESVTNGFPTSTYVNSAPIREVEVLNAVKFLSHPKVRESPIIYRQSFLERKGLTKEEIDEAFRHVPDPPSNISTTHMAVTNLVQTQGLTHNPQLAAVAPNGTVSKLGIISWFHWYHAIFSIGLLSLSGFGTVLLFKNTFIPRLKFWIRKVVSDKTEEDVMNGSQSRPSLVEQGVAAAKAAVAAAADVAQASQKILVLNTEVRGRYDELMNLLDEQVQEMKTIRKVIHKLEGQNSHSAGTSYLEQDRQVSVTNSQQSYANGKPDINSHSVKSSSSPAFGEPAASPHPKSYMEIIAMVQRGEIPPNIREINDRPPNPNQPLSNPSLAPRSKPWETQIQNGSSSVHWSQGSIEGFNSRSQDIGFNNQLNGEYSVPWLQQKN